MEKTNSVLIVDDDEIVRYGLSEKLAAEKFRVLSADSGPAALELFRSEKVDAVLLDYRMPDMDGLDTLRELRTIDQAIPVIMVTAHGDIATAVKAIKAGAYDFVEKPPQISRLIATLGRAIDKLRLERELTRLQVFEDSSLEWIFGVSAATRKNIEDIKLVAGSDLSVIIQGETGTGKSFLAKIIHTMSSRARGPFVRVDLNAIPETLLESELFGYERGAFTGAVAAKKGHFEAALGGTIFLDDLQNMSQAVQSKILNVVENKTICRVGGTTPMKLDVRILAASNRDLQGLVAEGGFREDLFYRLGEFIITRPPIRELKRDLEFFVNKFLEEAAAEFKVPVKGLTDEAVAALREYPWPGNIRELKNVIRRAALLSRSGGIGKEHLIFHSATRPEEDCQQAVAPLREAVKGIEVRMIKRALEQTNGSKTQTASVLQIDYKTLMRKMKEYDIL
jgi:DNA-binding NtrC family response regulator